MPFTPTQVEAIRAGMQPGLTMVGLLMKTTVNRICITVENRAHVYIVLFYRLLDRLEPEKLMSLCRSFQISITTFRIKEHSLLLIPIR